MSLDFDLYGEIDFGGEEKHKVEVFSRNITGNVCPMWTKAGVYESLYESRGKRAQDIINILESGLEHMCQYKELYLTLEPSNRWGSFDAAVDFLSDVIDNCKKYPLALISCP